ncbi:hypothetical protein [Chryseobacterium sp. G0240]|uniref:hypothetical protein n=1 Tax=Chryseobacterium sp. G0240 TaxID=2487066 RepID=UPI0011CE0F37|nr:hypothetical protein [Chryseobacterium sp. G0240]
MVIVALKRWVTSLDIYPIQDDSCLIIDIENMFVPELSIEDILEFYRDIYNICNVESSNNIIMSNSIDSALIIKIPLINQGRNKSTTRCMTASIRCREQSASISNSPIASSNLYNVSVWYFSIHLVSLILNCKAF